MSLTDAEAAGLARFLHRAGRLKFAPRTGWLDRGIPPEAAESVADHTFRTVLLAWLAADANLDRDRVLKLALIHDLAEAVTGDLPPYNPDLLPDEANDVARRTFLDQRHIRDAARTATKRVAEAEAMADLTADLPPTLAAEINTLWQELEDRTSPEARFVKQSDNLETFLQSREYLAAAPDRPMASFAAEVADVIDVPPLVALRDAISSALTYRSDPSAPSE